VGIPTRDVANSMLGLSMGAPHNRGRFLCTDPASFRQLSAASHLKSHMEPPEPPKQTEWVTQTHFLEA
jgi:hypothetical protein